jgi:hypothetical protein
MPPPRRTGTTAENEGLAAERSCARLLEAALRAHPAHPAHERPLAHELFAQTRPSAHTARRGLHAWRGGGTPGAAGGECQQRQDELVNAAVHACAAPAVRPLASVRTGYA